MRTIILGSGRGSNARAILQAQKDGKLGKAKVTHLYSDQPNAGILSIGKEYGIPTDYLDPSPYKTKLDGDAQTRYIETIASQNPDLLVLAGFMRVIKPPFLKAFDGKIINLHPSLLPSFPGLDAIGQAWRRGVKISGCTVHYVTEEVDGGPILGQFPVSIDEEDTLESFEAKIHAAEHRLLPAVIAKLSET